MKISTIILKEMICEWVSQHLYFSFQEKMMKSHILLHHPHKQVDTLGSHCCWLSVCLDVTFSLSASFSGSDTCVWNTPVRMSAYITEPLLKSIRKELNCIRVCLLFMKNLRQICSVFVFNADLIQDISKSGPWWSWHLGTWIGVELIRLFSSYTISVWCSIYTGNAIKLLKQHGWKVWHAVLG